MSIDVGCVITSGGGGGLPCVWASTPHRSARVFDGAAAAQGAADRLAGSPERAVLVLGGQRSEGARVAARGCWSVLLLLHSDVATLELARC